MADAPAVTVRVQAGPFDAPAEERRLRAGRTDIGAVVAFTGICRDEDGRLAALELEHYPGMAEAEMTRIACEAVTRWQLAGLTVIHRHGRIAPGEDIVLVIAAGGHRGPVLAAAGFVMDYLKTRAPFWKKEHPSDGASGDWVAAKADDDTAAARWNAQPDADDDGTAEKSRDS